MHLGTGKRKIIDMNEGDDDDCLGMDGATTTDANGSILTAKEAEPTIKEIKNRLLLGIGILNIIVCFVFSPNCWIWSSSYTPTEMVIGIRGISN